MRTSSLILLLVAVGLLRLSADCSAAMLVHQWSFNGDLTDSSGSGNIGTLAGGDATADYIEGKFGQAIDINSAEGVANTAPSNLPLLGGDAWTMNVWFNLSVTPASLSYLAGFGDHNTGTGHGQSRSLINFAAGYYLWGVNVDGTMPNPDIDSGTAYVVDGDWHMYTVVSDGTNISMFTDGVLVTSTANNLDDSTFNEVAVGNPSAWNSDFRGAVDEFAIWRGALNQNQINSLFASNVVVPEPASSMLLIATMTTIAAACRRYRQL